MGRQKFQESKKNLNNVKVSKRVEKQKYLIINLNKKNSFYFTHCKSGDKIP